jgi:hypothetical protein
MKNEELNALKKEDEEKHALKVFDDDEGEEGEGDDELSEMKPGIHTCKYLYIYMYIYVIQVSSADVVCFVSALHHN